MRFRSGRVRLLRTIKNGGGDTFKKGTVVMAEKSYGGYRITKLRKKRRMVIGGGEWFYTRDQVNRVSEKDFVKI